MKCHYGWFLLLLDFVLSLYVARVLLLSSLSSPASSPLCRVFVLIFLRHTMSLRNTVLQLFSCYYSWYLYRYFQCWIYITFVLSEVRVIRNVTIRQIGLEEPITKEIEQNQFTWYGHVQRMAEGRLLKIALKWIQKQRKHEKDRRNGMYKEDHERKKRKGRPVGR